MDKLDEIMEWKRKEIAPKVRPVSERELSQLGERQRGKKTFHEALAKPEELSVIAEIKRKSPSAGTIAENVSAVDQARIYENAGVDAMSILTDDKFFQFTFILDRQGEPENNISRTGVPILLVRKLEKIKCTSLRLDTTSLRVPSQVANEWNPVNQIVRENFG